MKDGQWMCAPSWVGERWEDMDYFNTKGEAIEYAKAETTHAYHDYKQGNALELFGSCDYDGEDIEDEYEVFAKIYVGRLAVFDPCVNEDHVIDCLVEDAYDFGGEWAESYLDHVSKEQREELGEMLTATFKEWSKKHGQNPTFFIITNIEEVEIGMPEDVCVK